MSESNPNPQSVRAELRAKLINDLALLVYLSLRREPSQPRTGKVTSEAPQPLRALQDKR